MLFRSTLSQAATRAVPKSAFSILTPQVTRTGTLLTTALGAPTNAVGLSIGGIDRGMLVFGDGVSEGTFVTAINAGVIQLSQTNQRGGDSELRFVKPDYTQQGVLSLRSSTITGLSSTVDLSEKMLVFGPGIPTNTRILSVNKTANSITLSKSATAGDGQALQQLAFFRDGRIASGLSTTVDLSAGMDVTGTGIQIGRAHV